MPMIVIAILMLGFSQQATAGAARLDVQVTDESWIPRPGMTVTVRKQGSCETDDAVEESRDMERFVTDAGGRVAVPVDVPADYIVTTHLADGTVADRRCLALRKPAPVYALLLLARSEEWMGVDLFMPSTATTETEKRSWQAAGVYKAPFGVLRILPVEDGKGIVLELPSLERATFTRRRGWSFYGPTGHIEFILKGGSVAGLTLSNRVQADRVP